MKRTSAVLLLGGLATFALAASAQPQTPDLAPLVSVHAKLVFHLVRTDLYHENIFVAVGGASNANLSFLPSTSFWTANAASAQGSAAQVGALRTAIGAAQAGVQTDCAIGGTQGWSGTYEISWYGRNARANDFVVTLRSLPATGSTCPASVSDLIDAIESYSSNVLGIAVQPALP